MARKDRYDAPFRPSLKKPPADDATEVTIRTERGLLPVDDETNFGEGKRSELEAELLKVDPRALAQRLARARQGGPARSLPEDQPTTTVGPQSDPPPPEEPAALARRLAREAKARLEQVDDLNDSTARALRPDLPRTSEKPARPRAQRPRVVRQKQRQTAEPAPPRRRSEARDPEADRRAEAARVAELERRAVAARKAEQERRAEAARRAQVEERRAEAARKAEQERRAEAAREAKAEERRQEARRAEARKAELDRLEKLNRMEEARRERLRRDEARSAAQTPVAAPARHTPMPSPPRRTRPPERAKAPPVPLPEDDAAPEVEAPPSEAPAALARRLAAEAMARLARSGTPAPERTAARPAQPAPVPAPTEPPAPSSTPAPSSGRLADRAPAPKKQKLSAAEAVARFSAEPPPQRSYSPPTGATAQDILAVSQPAPAEATPLLRPLSMLAETLPGVLIESEQPVDNPEVFTVLWEAHQARAIRAGRLQLAATATLLLNHVSSGRPLLAARIGYANQQWAAFLANDDGQLLAIVESPDIYLAGIR